MTMLYGFASKESSYPLGHVGNAFNVGVKMLDTDKRRYIVEGRGGTVVGLSFAVTKDESEELIQSRPVYASLPTSIGHKITLKNTNSLGDVKWFTLRGRVSRPEYVQNAIEAFNLENFLVLGALGIITCRENKIPNTAVDSSAPVETLPGFTNGTVGQITTMIENLPALGITPGKSDGRNVSKKIAASIRHAHGDVSTSAMAERIYLLRKFGVLPYALHWIMLDQNLEYVHVLHSKEPGGATRKAPYLYIGQNTQKTIVFASKREMIESSFSNMSIEAPPAGEVYTRFT